MRSPKLLDIFNIITCNGMREMTEERFSQAVEELFNSDTCPICGKRKVKIDGGWEHICTQKIEKCDQDRFGKDIIDLNTLK